ncbi:MAG: ABC transporter ATP-binding protein [Agathobacter sp.]|nr:ABC transporter ATP-binding protein [Agathobacter sp.]
MNYVMETQNLTKKYQNVTVVDHVNLHIPKGKIYGLLGRNGAGKTTIMKMMLQLVSPTDGKIIMFGKDYCEQVKDTYQKIGSIIETPGFYTNLTGQENLEILARLRRNVSKESVLHALEIVGLDKEKKKQFSDYSLGMKQRLGIAAAIMHQPQLLILDEPINGLDPIGISEIRQFLYELSRTKGTTILISSHVLNEIEQIADMIGVINQGKLVEEVNMQELHKRKYVVFTVSDPLTASRMLENRCKVRDYEIQEHTIKIFEPEFNIGYFNQILVENQVVVTAINSCEENLEDYFTELIGGSGIA